MTRSFKHIDGTSYRCGIKSRWKIVSRHTQRFFGTNGTWYGFVLRVGILWFGGIQFVHACVSTVQDGQEFTMSRVLQLASDSLLCGILAGFGMFGITGVTERLRHSEADEPR